MSLNNRINKNAILCHNIKIASIVIIIYILLNVIMFQIYEKQTNSYNQEIISSISKYLEKDFSQKISDINSISNIIEFDLHITEQELFNICKQYINGDNQNDIYLSNKNGIFKSIKTGKLLDRSDRVYFKEAINGNLFISNIAPSKFDDSVTRNVIVYSAPIKREGEIIGVIAGLNTTEEIRTQMIESYELELYNITVFDSTGNKIIGDKDISSIKIDKINEKQLENDKTLIINDGFMFNLNSIAVQKIEAENEFYVVHSVKMTNVFSEIVLFFIIILIVSTVILYISIKMSTKNKREKMKNEKIISRLKDMDERTYLLKYDKFIDKVFEIVTTNKDKKYAIVNFDVDNFKLINNIYGYSIGDSVLRNIANDLKRQLKEEEVACRTSNDLFMFIIEVGDTHDIILEKISNINNLISKFTINDRTIRFKLSFGVYIIHNNKIENSSLIRKYAGNSDIARMSTKLDRTKYVSIFDDSLLKKRLEDMVIEKDILNGIKNNEFKLNYQPKVNTKTQKLEGAEALVRWFHPTLGFISPLKFIAIAEKTGDINLLGKWIFEQVCKDLSNLKKKGIELVPISVNLSRVELYQEDLIDSIESTIKEYDIDPEFIEMEITESTTLNDLEFIKVRISQLKKLGLSVSMDDFGTGNSNLSNLKELDIDVLKIDRSFSLDIEVNPKSEKLVNLIIDLSKNFGYKVVAEGIESKNQVEILKDMGCDLIQGYVFSKPIFIDEFEDILIKGGFN